MTTRAKGQCRAITARMSSRTIVKRGVAGRNERRRDDRIKDTQMRLQFKQN